MEGAEAYRARGWDVEKWVELAGFEVDDSAYSVARRISDGGRRNARALLAEGWNKSMNTSTSTSRSTSRSRGGALERLSVCGSRGRPPLALGFEKWAELTDFGVDDSAFPVALRICDGGRRDAHRLLVEGRTKSTNTSTSTSRSRSGAIERLSVRGRWDGPPLAPPS